MKAFIIGNSGAGKTEFARKLSLTYGIQHYNLDKIYWHNHNYNISRSSALINSILGKITNKSNWIIEGNYSNIIEPHIDKAQILVWLYPPNDICVENIKKREPDVSQAYLNRVKSYDMRNYGSCYKTHSSLWKRFSKKKIKLTDYNIIRNKSNIE